MLLACTAAADDQPEAVVMAETVQVPPGETLPDVARAHDVGFVELMAANPGADPWLPGQRPLLLPTTHLPPSALDQAPLVINLGDMRLYWRPPSGEVQSFPMGIGRDGFALSPTMTRVVGKRRDPVWVPPPSVRAEKPHLPERVPPGPDNPMGAFALDLALPLVRIHGTNLPDGVGRRVSHGCLRLYPEDIARLFPQVPVGTAVAVVDQPIKLARLDNELWLEVHPGQDLADSIEARRPIPATPPPALATQITATAGDLASRIDWQVVEWAGDSRLGIPVRITRPQAGPPMALLPGK